MHINYCTHLRLDSQMSAAVGAIRSELEVHDALTINFVIYAGIQSLPIKGSYGDILTRKLPFLQR